MLDCAHGNCDTEMDEFACPWVGGYCMIHCECADHMSDLTMDLE